VFENIVVFFKFQKMTCSQTDCDMKEQLRLEGHQKYPQYHGCSISSRAHLRDLVLNPEINVLSRPVHSEEQAQIVAISAIDQLRDYRQDRMTLSKQNLWDTVKNMVFDQGTLKRLQVRENGETYTALIDMPVVGTTIERLDAVNHQNYQAKQFRWAGRFYDPHLLYTMKHDKEFVFTVWSDVYKNQSNGIDDVDAIRLQSLHVKKCSDRAFFEMHWNRFSTPHTIRLKGEDPKIFRFPCDYMPYKSNPKKVKRAKRKKVHRQHLQIVQNPDHLGFVKSFQLQIFDHNLRKWMSSGTIQGNQNAKTWITVNLLEHFEANLLKSCHRLRVIPVDIYQRLCFSLDVWGNSEKEVRKSAVDTITYELKLSRPMLHKISMRKTSWLHGGENDWPKKYGNLHRDDVEDFPVVWKTTF